MPQALSTRRRWFQFGLGTLLLVVTMLAVLLSYAAWSKRQWEMEVRYHAPKSYRTWRKNVESFGGRLTAAEHLQAQKQIDDHWRATYPGTPIPKYP
jgi:hypothetical protein